MEGMGQPHGFSNSFKFELKELRGLQKDFYICVIKELIHKQKTHISGTEMYKINLFCHSQCWHHLLPIPNGEH